MSFWSLRCTFVLGALVCAGVSQARPEFWVTFQKTYQVQPGSKVAEAGCKNCHTSPPQRNRYGIAVEQTLVNGNLRAAGLRQVESQDSGNGKTFRDLIQTDVVPGDASGELTTEPSPESNGELVPKHTFHPLFVHFPIALFFFGVFLEVFGANRKRADMRAAGFWSLLAALLSLVAVLPTGLIARARLGFPLEGDMLIHFLAAIGATGSLCGLVLCRRTGPTCHFGYWSLMAVTAALIGLTGHFGSQLIFGS